MITKKKLLKSLIYASLISASSFNFSCNKRVSEDTQVKIEEDSLLIKVQNIQDSLSTAWDNMITDDDEKLGYMRRILLEISYSNFNQSRTEELNILVDELKKLRYDQKSMVSSALIDQYDSATSMVSRQVIQFGQDFLQNNESDLVSELIHEINLKNNYVLLYRVHYDSFAEELNGLIDDYGPLFEEKNISIEKKPLFKLSMDDI